MKTKLFSLLSLSVLFLVMVMGVVSAVTLAEWSLTENETATNVDANLNAGEFSSNEVTFTDFDVDDGAGASDWPTGASPLDTSKYFEVTISPKTDYTLTITDINFDYSASITGPASFELQYSKQSGFISSETLTTKDDVPKEPTFKTSSNSGLSVQVSSGETLTLRWFGYNFDAESNQFFIKDLAILGTVAEVTEPEPEELNFCEYDDGVSENPGELKIKDIDITNKGEFGDDEEWFPFDEIEVEVEIENKGDYDVDDIVVEWGVYNTDTKEWTIEVDEEDEFNLKDDDKEKLTITFRVDDDMDEDLEDLNGGDFILYVRATGVIDDSDSPNNDEDTCASDSKNIDIIIESDFIILNDFQFPELVSCGTDVQITADVWNIGDSEQEEVYLVVYNKELGINEEIEIGDIDMFEDEKLVFDFQVPEDAEEKWYALEFTVYDEDGEIYENDYDDKESVFIVSFKVEGSCVVEPQVMVVPNLESGGKAGEELVIKATITNTGSKLATYELDVTGYDDWATLINVEPSTIILNAGEPKDVLITFNVNADAAGKESSFNIVFSGDASATQHVQGVLIEESKLGGFLTGNIISEGNWYLWGIGALNVILIIVIVLVALRVAKKE